MPWATVAFNWADSPAHVARSATDTCRGAYTVTVAQALPAHPLASVIVTQYSPGSVTLIDDEELPVLQATLYGAAPFWVEQVSVAVSP